MLSQVTLLTRVRAKAHTQTAWLLNLLIFPYVYIIREKSIISSDMKKIKLGLDSGSVIGRNAVLGEPQKKNFLEALMGRGGFCRKLYCDIKL